MSFVDGEISSPASALIEEPQVAQGCCPRAWYGAEFIVAQIGHEVVKNWEKQERPRRQKLVKEHADGGLTSLQCREEPKIKCTNSSSLRTGMKMTARNERNNTGKRLYAYIYMLHI